MNEYMHEINYFNFLIILMNELYEDEVSEYMQLMHWWCMLWMHWIYVI